MLFLYVVYQMFVRYGLLYLFSPSRGNLNSCAESWDYSGFALHTRLPSPPLFFFQSAQAQAGPPGNEKNLDYYHGRTIVIGPPKNLAPAGPLRCACCAAATSFDPQREEEEDTTTCCVVVSLKIKDYMGARGGLWNYKRMSQRGHRELV